MKHFQHLFGICTYKRIIKKLVQSVSHTNRYFWVPSLQMLLMMLQPCTVQLMLMFLCLSEILKARIGYLVSGGTCKLSCVSPRQSSVLSFQNYISSNSLSIKSSRLPLWHHCSFDFWLPPLFLCVFFTVNITLTVIIYIHHQVHNQGSWLPLRHWGQVFCIFSLSSVWAFLECGESLHFTIYSVVSSLGTPS